MAQDFVKMGYGKMYALKGGWKEWVSAQMPVGILLSDVAATKGLSRQRTDRGRRGITKISETKNNFGKG